VEEVVIQSAQHTQPSTDTLALFASMHLADALKAEREKRELVRLGYGRVAVVSRKWRDEPLAAALRCIRMMPMVERQRALALHRTVHDQCQIGINVDPWGVFWQHVAYPGVAP
jgi:hypothetical protein